MRGIELLKVARGLNKFFFTIADLEKITGLPRRNLYVTLKRGWIKGLLNESGKEYIFPP